MVVTALIVATAGATTWALVAISSASIDASERLRQYTTIEQVVGLLGSRLSSTNSADLGWDVPEQVIVGTETPEDPNRRPYSYAEIVTQDQPDLYFSLDQLPSSLAARGGAQLDQPSLLPRYVSSATNRAISLGANGYLDSAPASSQSGFDLNGNQWAIEAWFSAPTPSAEPGTRVLYARQPVGPAIVVEQGAEQQFNIQLYSTTGEESSLLASGPLPAASIPGDVHHLVVNWSQGQAEIIVDGQPVASSSASGSVEWPGNQGLTSFGALAPVDQESEAQFFLGAALDELAFYSQTLSELRIRTHLAAGIFSSAELLQADCRQFPAASRQPGETCFPNIVEYQIPESERLVTEPGLLPTSLAGDQFFFTRGGQCHRIMFIARRSEIWLARADSCASLLMSSGVARGPNQQIAGQQQFPVSSPYYDRVLDGILARESLPGVNVFLLAEGVESIDGDPVFNYLDISKNSIAVDSQAQLGSNSFFYRGLSGEDLVNEVAEVQVAVRVVGNPERPASDQRIGNRDYRRSIYLNQLCPPSS
jgi:hypothetical protein